MNGSVVVARIGRLPTPAEETLALARESGEFAGYIGRNLYLARVGGRWASLSAEERSGWIALAIDGLAEQADEEPDPPSPEPPNGGEPLLEVA